MRYLEIKKTEDNCVLNIFDKTNENTYKNCIKMHGLNAANTDIIFSYFLQQIFNCQLLEKNLYNTFINNLKENLDDIIIDD